MTAAEFSKMALSFPGVVKHSHFDRTAFKVESRRIFATLHEASGTANLKLSEVDQSVFCSFEGKTIYQVPNKWGLQGWTTFALESIPKDLMLDALNVAYQESLKSKSKRK